MAQGTINTPRETTIQRIATALENILNKIVDTSRASNIDYDNTESELSATKVQGAIDELASEKADKSTSLAGYGITNAYTKAEVNDALNNNVETIAEAIKQWDIGSYTIDLYGIGLPETYYTASSTYSGKRYLDVATGKMYDCVQTGPNTYTWRQAPVVLQLKSDINASAISDIQEDISTSLTATGNPLTIESSESNLVECVAEVEAVQEGSGDPSPDNIRPITGQTEVVIEDCGKNLFDGKNVGYGILSNGTLGANPNMVTSDYIPVIQGNYYLTNVVGGANGRACAVYDSNKSFVRIIELSGADAVSGTITIESDEAYIRCACSASYKDSCQIEKGSTASDFEPYKGKTYRVEIGQKNKVEETLSGYTIASTGLITVDSNNTFDMQIAKIEKGVTYTITTDDIFCVGYFTEKPANGVYSYDNQRHVNTNQRTFTAPITGYIAFRTTKGYATPQCEQGSQATPYVPYNPNLPDAIYGSGLDVLTGELRVTHGEIANYNGEILPSTWISDRDVYASGTTPTTGAQVVYELATPYTIQLTPQQIRLLKGTNNISCNTGDLSIKYYPDNVLGQLKGDIEKGLNAYYDYQIQALWDKIEELQA